jgi:hypothetical protein
MKNNNKILQIIGSIILLVLVFIGGVAVGRKGGSLRMMGNPGGPNMMNGGNRMMRGGQGGGAQGTGMMAGFVMGEILSKDATSMTLKLRDGGSKIVLFSPSTTVTKSASSTIESVVVGNSVMVSGKTNADGSVTATNIDMRNIRN